MIPIKIHSAWRGTSDCLKCGVRDLVLFADLNEEDFSKIHAPIDDMEFESGDQLYLQGQQALGIFTLRSGLVKLVRWSTDGRPRILRVLRAGDVIGIEALASGQFDSEAVSLAQASVCRIPLSVIRTLSAQSPRLYARLMQKWQQALKDADDWLADMNFGTAKQRVARLALKMRDVDADHLTTLFSREDMGAMLDLKMETVSREISGLVREGAIKPLDNLGRRYEISNETILKHA